MQIKKVSGIVFCTTVVSVLFSVGCGNGSGVGGNGQILSRDQGKIKTTIQMLRQGELIQRMNLAFNGNEGEVESGTATEANAPAPNEIVLDPCPRVPKPGSEATEEEKKAALHEFALCVRTLWHPIGILSDAISYYKIFNVGSLEIPLSSMTDAEMEAFLIAKKPEMAAIDDWNLSLASYHAKVRTRFNDEELQELVYLIQRRKKTLFSLEGQIFAAVDARSDLIAHFGKTVNRYAALLALRQTKDDQKGGATQQALAKVFQEFKSEMEIPESLQQLATRSENALALLHPFGMGAIVPSEGWDDKPLDPKQENPYSRVESALSELGGPDGVIEMILGNYQAMRDQVKIQIPEHPAPAMDAVRVAFIDSGIDYHKYPDLGMFLGSGKDGQIGSADFIDGGNIPWVPALQKLSHGSKVVATLLTVISQQAPEILEERKIDLAMWKNWTIREFLSGAFPNVTEWYPPGSLQLGIMNKLASNEPAPKIVSVSMGFKFEPFLQKINKPDILKDSPWLWVMAAGNDGKYVEARHTLGPASEGLAGCFNDIPVEHRDGSRILCVGALVQGIVEPKIAAYSNYGDPIDVYAFESYISLCPSGTSCATPAITAAAAMIAAKFPKLTPSQIKEVIVESSVEKVLKVDLNLKDPDVAAKVKEGVLQTERKVKVFNPMGMMARAFEVAKKKVE